jgi:hypothetical protein
MAQLPGETTQPDQRKIAKIQAKRTVALADVEAADPEHLTIDQVSERLKWKIEQALFLFRPVRGKVVTKDPVTGVESMTWHDWI